MSYREGLEARRLDQQVAALTEQVRALVARVRGGEVETAREATVAAKAVEGLAAPVIGATSAGDGFAIVNWSPPPSDGGWPVTGYRVNVWRSIYNTLWSSTVVGNVSTFTATGLTNGSGYYFTVVAINAKGEGPPSGRSVVVTPGSGAPRVAGHIPASYSNWSGPAGPYRSLSQRIIWNYNPVPGPGQATHWAWFASMGFGFAGGRGGYMGLQTDANGKRAIFSIWRALSATASAPGAVASSFGNPRTFHANSTSGSQVVTSSDANFVPGDVGRPIEAAGIGGEDFSLPSNYAQSVDSPTQVTMTAACTATASGVDAIISDEGFGYHVLWPFDWIPGHLYRFELVESTTPHFWNGNMNDETTGTHYDIGYMEVPASWGRINAGTYNFMEWYAPQPTYCDEEVASSVTFREPIFLFDESSPVADAWVNDDFNTGGFSTLCDSSVIAASPDGRTHLNGTQP